MVEWGGDGVSGVFCVFLRENRMSTRENMTYVAARVLSRGCAESAASYQLCRVNETTSRICIIFNTYGRVIAPKPRTKMPTGRATTHAAHAQLEYTLKPYCITAVKRSPYSDLHASLRYPDFLFGLFKSDRLEAGRARGGRGVRPALPTLF